MYVGPHIKSLRALVTAGATIALLAATLALANPSTALGQDTADCEVTDLGTLGNSADSVLEAQGRWTTEDCDSRFRAGSDAHTFRFHVEEAGRIRIGLSSAAADSYLYLLAENGSRIADNDDSGERLDARIERDLGPGTYLMEATTVGGRDRGPADFTLTVSRVAGCDFVDLGTLEPDNDLTASGSWTLDTCGSRFVAAHPAHAYSFTVTEGARVRIDLKSENGDPVLSLASLERGIIGANDDGGERRDSRIEQYLHPGLYLIEATTYLARDLQPLQADFTLTVRLVDESARQQRASLKIEEIRTPAEVVAGDPFPVHYRVGNLGGADLPDDGSNATIYVVGRRVFDLLDPVSGIWDAGVAYHTGDETESASSTQIDDITAFEARFSEPGPSWIFVGIATEDPDGNEIGWHGLWHNLLVLSGPTFDPVDVKVDGPVYTVSTKADDDGEVTTTVSAVADPEAEVDPAVQAKAIYTAGVRTQLLDGIFERPTIAELSRTAEPDPVSVPDPSSSTLLAALGQRFASTDGISEMRRSLARGEAINPIAVEETVLTTYRAALSQHASIASSWNSLLMSGPLSFDKALAVQSQLAFAERLIAPAVTAGEIVAAARAAEEGWDDPDVRTMMAEHASCRPGPTALRSALEAAGVSNVDGLVALDAEMRFVRPVHGLAIDGALCAAADADWAIFRFLQRLAIGDSDDLLELLAPQPAEPAPEPHRLRIIARLGDDGRIEHGVELSGGDRILPEERFLPADASTGKWQVSGAIEVDQVRIGQIRTRRLADGRVEMGFVSADGSAFTPDVAYLPADHPEGVWLYSSEIAVPAATMLGTSNAPDG